MIDAYFDQIEKAITDNPLAVFIDLHRVYTSPKTAYIKGEITFIDASSFVIFQHVRIEEFRLTITAYRYHYMDSDKGLIFRYDNAPHYPGFSTFPHHKHLPSGVQETTMPSIKKVLDEIHLNIIQGITS